MNHCSWELGYDAEGDPVLCGKPAWQKGDRHAECWASDEELETELEKEDRIGMSREFRKAQ